MDAERWAEVKELFHAALAAPQADRSELVRRAAGSDDRLRNEVESLLASFDVAGGFLERAPGDLAATWRDGDARSSPDLLLPGTRLGGYEIVDLVGAGGMGRVYRAHHLALGRSAAIKLLGERVSAELSERLQDEGETLARLQHPAIAMLYEIGEVEGTSFLAMEYVPGPTLRDKLAAGPLPAAHAVAITAILLEALDHAHAAGVVHRDIKPENIIVTGERTAKLLDFGVALLTPMADPGADPSFANDPIEIVGTVGYMSPEQMRGEPTNARSDVFSLATVLYEALTGQPAFPGSTPDDQMAAVVALHANPAARAGLPAELWQILSHALALDPTDRYPSARAFLRDLQSVGAGEPRRSACEAHARGHELVLRHEKGSLEQARDLFEHAIATDPSYVPALTGLAAFHCMRFGFTTEARELVRASEYVTQALAMDALCADAYLWCGH